MRARKKNNYQISTDSKYKRHRANIIFGTVTALAIGIPLLAFGCAVLVIVNFV